ncbi:MAG: branched-chain amino acid ABC transporter substrate-binding protein, partial [bacterium]
HISPEVKERFFREAKVLSKLKHPNIVSIFDFGVTETGICYMVMEYITGRTLGQIVSKDNGLPIDVIVEVMEQVCSGVGAAHRENLIHRDLKPSNIFLADISGGKSSVKVLDFGIAKALGDFSDENNNLTKDGIILGTAGYVSPEQINELPDVDIRADIYALGAILYYMFTGNTPYKGKIAEVITKQITQTISITNKLERFKTFEGEVLKPIISKAMSLNRDDRYQNTEEFFDTLYQNCADSELLRDSKSGRLVSVSNFLSEVFDQTNEIRKPTGAFKTNSLTEAKESHHTTKNTNSIKNTNRANNTNRTNNTNKDDSISFSVKRNSFKTVAAAIVTLLIIGVTGLLYLNKESFLGTTQEKKQPNVPQQEQPKIVQQGVTDTEVLMGMSAAFSGASKELGRQMKLGIDTYFNEVNTSGGINNRKLNLVGLDDGYEPVKALESMKDLLEKRKVFGIIGNVGTPTAEVTVPYALEKKAIFFGAFTGAGLLRKDPPDKYVFNYRASYAEETSYIVEYLVEVKKLQPSQIAVFAQTDGYGDAGFSGVVKAMRKYKLN